MNKTQERYLQKAIKEQEDSINAARILIMKYTAIGNETERSAFGEELIKLEEDLEKMLLYSGHVSE